MSVPAVWQHVNALEKTYGSKLFEKVGRRVEPTAFAKQLYETIDEILVRLDSTFRFTQSPSGDETITLVTGVRMMIEDLAAPLAAFRKHHSNPILIRHGNNQRAEELILAGEADLALTLEAGPGEMSPQISTAPAYSIEFLAIAPKRHAYATAKASGLRELVKHQLIVTAKGTHGRDALEQALHFRHLTANIAVETDNSGFTVACVQAGMGVGILAGRPDGIMCKPLVVRSLRRQLGRRKIVFMWRRGRELPNAVQALMDTVRRSLD